MLPHGLMSAFVFRFFCFYQLYYLISVTAQTFCGEARWPNGRASDSGARGRGFDPHSGRRVVSLSKIHSPPKKYW